MSTLKLGRRQKNPANQLTASGYCADEKTNSWPSETALTRTYPLRLCHLARGLRSLYIDST